VGDWVIRTARGSKGFYDIDTPVTLAKLARGDYEYITPELVRSYDIYFSFTGGPTPGRLERKYGSPRARVLYCSTDPSVYYPEQRGARWDLGYLGTYSPDRQPALERLMFEPARRWADGRFVVAGPMYPEAVEWPVNTQHLEHLAPPAHRNFYNAQKFTLNVTRADMLSSGYSPSVRLFEAAACGTPIISDYWKGLESIFRIGKEILVARTPEDALGFLKNLPEEERLEIGERARRRILAEHTAAIRAAEFEAHVAKLLEENAAKRSLTQPRMSAIHLTSQA
jgi:spore maturation protein CgeB